MWHVVLGGIDMADPILFISTFHIRQGRRAEFERMFVAAVEHIRSTKPGTALYAAYSDPATSTVRVVHAFPDAAAIAVHFEGTGERSAAVESIIEPAGFAIYGPAPDAVVEQLRREAAEAGVGFEHLPGVLGGFLRTAAG
jgi:quinol monooxygenase YgiN